MYHTGDRLLGVFQEGFDIPHDWFEELAFVEQHAVPVGQLFFPVLLPFGEGMFFEEVVGFQDDEGRGCFETDPTFDTNDRIPYVDIAADGERGGDFLEAADGIGRFCKQVSIQAQEFPFFEAQGEGLGFYLH